MHWYRPIIPLPSYLTILHVSTSGWHLAPPFLVRYALCLPRIEVSLQRPPTPKNAQEFHSLQLPTSTESLNAGHSDTVNMGKKHFHRQGNSHESLDTFIPPIILLNEASLCHVFYAISVVPEGQPRLACLPKACSTVMAFLFTKQHCNAAVPELNRTG